MAPRLALEARRESYDDVMKPRSDAASVYRMHDDVHDACMRALSRRPPVRVRERRPRHQQARACASGDRARSAPPAQAVPSAGGPLHRPPPVRLLRRCGAASGRCVAMPMEAPPAAGGEPPRGDPWAQPDGDSWSELLAEVYAARPFRRVRSCAAGCTRCASRREWRALAPTAFRALAAPRRAADSRASTTAPGRAALVAAPLDGRVVSAALRHVRGPKWLSRPASACLPARVSVHPARRSR